MELLVVITIIGMLAALIMAAVGSARENARQAQCMSRQHSLYMAAATYEKDREGFPSWRVQFRGNSGSSTEYYVPWLVALLPHLDNKPLYELWKDGQQKKQYLAFMVCPSNPPQSTAPGFAPLAYLANLEIFREGRGGKGRSLDSIGNKDGAGYTLLFSETTADREWSNVQSANQIGFSAAGQFKSQLQSKHTGGVVAAFCDGKTKFLREDIDEETFKRLVRPDDGYTLEDADFL